MSETIVPENPTEEIPCNFVADFKVGDNLVYNCQILCKLVECNTDGYFNKLVVLQVTSILEASLAEIIERAQNFSREGVPDIKETDRAEIAGKKIDKFCVVIDVLRKYQVLDYLGRGIYDDLHRLRRFRNKIHIQDDIKVEGVPRDEDQAFSNEECSVALKLNLHIIKYLSDRLCRPQHIHKYVESLVVPAPKV